MSDFDLKNIGAVFAEIAPRGRYAYTAVDKNNRRKVLRSSKTKYRSAFIITHLPRMMIIDGKMGSTGVPVPVKEGPYVSFGDGTVPINFEVGVRFIRFMIKW